MWTYTSEQTSKPNTLKIAISQQGKPLHFEQVIAGWQDSADFRSFYINMLAEVAFPAYFWEMPAITAATLNRPHEFPYEFIVADSPSLASVRPDSTAFASHFHTATADESVIAFENLGGDAMLVAPCPVGYENAYPHLAAFVCNAPVEQTHQFFQRLGTEVIARVSHQPLWISTSGLGVYWLHARLDSTPKYYTYAPYRRADYAT